MDTTPTPRGERPPLRAVPDDATVPVAEHRAEVELVDVDAEATAATGPAGPVGPAETAAGPVPEPDHSDTADTAGAAGAGEDRDRDEDHDGGGRRVLVDPPDGPEDRPGLVERVRSGQRVERRPIIPAWLRDRTELRAVLAWLVSHIWHTSAYHAVRCPKYAARLAGRSPRGALRLIAGVAGWVFDGESRPLRAEAVRRSDAEQFMKLERIRRDRVRLRLLVAIPAALGVAGLVLVALTAGSGLAHLAAAGVLVLLLGLAGAPADKPLLDVAVVKPRAQRLTSTIVTRALGSLGIAQINYAVSPKGAGIAFVAPITRDGPGWRADVDLPYGVTPSDVLERRERLASGLRRPLGCVWPEPAHDAHAGRLVLWVGDQDLSQAKPAPWPLAKHGQADVFRPVPFGTDQRGRPVAVLLMFASVLIGAMPRVGKTFALRVLLLAAALDPTVQLRVFELKGTGDLSALEQVAHQYVSGVDDASIAAVVDALREVHRELETRAKKIADLPRDVCPENKVTPQLAGRRSLGLHPLVFSVDECQELFAHPTYGKEAGELATAIIKRGPALGVILLLATQRPDKDSLPTGVSANVGIRLCLRVMGQTENDMVLGTSKYRNGIRATTFTARDRGIGWLVGATDDPLVVRSYYLDGPAADRIAARARALRTAAGALSGLAAGDHPTTDQAPTASLLDDLAAVMPPGEDEVWSESLLARLADLRPDAYAGWTPAQLAAAVKPYGITTKQVWGTDPATGRGANRRGLVRRHVLDTVAARRKERDPDLP